MHEINQLSLFTSAIDKAWAIFVHEKEALRVERRKIREIKEGDAEYVKLRDALATEKMALKARMEVLRKDYHIDAIDAEIKEAKLRVSDAQVALSGAIVKLRKVSPQETINIGGKEKKIQIRATLKNA